VSVRIDAERLRARVGAYRPGEVDEPDARRAAVAALLRFDRGPAEVLLMKRSEREGDPWSGHVSFPGGNQSTADADLMATAVRETREEVGVDLGASARLLGRLDTMRPISRRHDLLITITPFVFEQVTETSLTPGAEAESCFWLPLDLAAAGVLSSQYEYRLGPTPMVLPCWRYQGYVVWGLTYRMLCDLIDLAGEPAGPQRDGR